MSHRTQQMRLREVTQEAVRNLSSGTSRAVTLALLVAIVSGVLAGLDTSAQVQIIGAADEFRERGASITILTAENSIDGRACDALAELDGVRAAGAVTQREQPLVLAAIPQNPVTYFAASPGFGTMLPQSTGQQRPGVLLPTEMAKTLGVVVGDPIHTTDGTTTLGGTYQYPDDGRPRGMGYAAIGPSSPEQRYDQCWIDAFPVSAKTRDALYTAIAADSSLPDSGPAVTQHNTTLGAATDPTTAYTGRPTAWAPAASFTVTALIGFAAIWSRRLEHASALHSGVRKIDQAGTVLLETLAWSLSGTLTTVPVIAFVTQHLAESDHLPVVLTATLTPALAASGALLGALAAVVVVREQRLFAYFKSR